MGTCPLSKDAIQQIVQHYIKTHGYPYAPQQNDALRSISTCRTAVLGGTKIVCGDCGHEQYLYKSCGNRNCPQCNSIKQLKWKEARSSEFIQVTYFHAVFTVPSQLHELFLAHPKKCYNALFKAVSETLLTLAADPKHLDARIGFVCVLHSWGATLSFPPHLHVMIPGCGLNHLNKLVTPKGNFLFPVKVMSSLFRGKLLDELKRLSLDDSIDYRTLYNKDWVVYLKESMPGSKHVVDYLSRYTHKIAITSKRIVSRDSESVTFRYKDYRDHNKVKEMTLSEEEFMRRYLLHVLPKGFTRIRFYGLLSNRSKKDALDLIRRLLNQTPPEDRLKNRSVFEILTLLFGDHYCCCRKCGSKNLSQITVAPVLHPE